MRSASAVARASTSRAAASPGAAPSTAASRSETTALPVSSRFARSRSGNTTSPSASSAAVAAAPPASRRQSRSGCHSACHGPAGRSSSASIDCASTAASAGTCSAADRISVASTGLRFCGIADEPPRPSPAGSATSPTSVLAIAEHVDARTCRAPR